MSSEDSPTAFGQSPCPFIQAGLPCANQSICPYQHQSVAPPPNVPANASYKTRRCRHFDMGRCKLAAFCNFAHGDEELRYYKGEGDGSYNPSTAQQLNTSTPQHLNSSTPQPLNISASQKLKLTQLEQNLEHFSQTQAMILEQLKGLAMSFEASNGQYSEQTSAQIEECVKRFYQSAMQYSETVSQLTDVRTPQPLNASTAQQLNTSTPQQLNASTAQASDDSNQTRNQLIFLISRLKPMHSRNPKAFDLILKAEKSLESDLFKSATFLEEILYDRAVPKSTELAHRNLLNEARSRR